MRLRTILTALACVVLVAMTIAMLAPYAAAEYLLRQHGALVGPKPNALVRGRWAGDYFLVETIDATTFAIGEPRYYQGNYSYLIVGSERAVLFDAGTGNRDIVPVVRALTTLPVTVIPSHLHFDHVGALGRFERTALPDVPSLRARSGDGWLSLGRYEFLGLADGLPAPRFAVDEWWSAGQVIDLGGRRLQVVPLPGHTPTSVGLYDGDRRLLALLDPAARVYAAHMVEDSRLIVAPVLEIDDLRALEHALIGIESGAAKSSGWYPCVFPVRGSISLATGYSWNNR